MHLRVKAGAALLVGVIVLGVTLVKSPVAASPGGLSDFFAPREKLRSFEIYHIAHSGATYRTNITIEHLLSGRSPEPDDYVRIGYRNAAAVADLYQALNSTAVDASANCWGKTDDVRWAIVLNYSDRPREAVAFGLSYKCVQLLSRKEPLGVSDALLKYIAQNFPFMHV
jgi:hypothetical protein